MRPIASVISAVIVGAVLFCSTGCGWLLYSMAVSAKNHPYSISGVRTVQDLREWLLPQSEERRIWYGLRATELWASRYPEDRAEALLLFQDACHKLENDWGGEPLYGTGTTARTEVLDAIERRRSIEYLLIGGYDVVANGAASRVDPELRCDYRALYEQIEPDSKTGELHAEWRRIGIDNGILFDRDRQPSDPPRAKRFRPKSRVRFSAPQ